MITDSLGLEPLGGIYQGRFWPVSIDALPELEAYLGRPLSSSYVEFVTTYGMSRPAEEMIIELPDGSPVAFDSFYGDPPEHDVSSVVSLARQYPELRLLTIGSAENGLFFLSPDGKVLFQRSGFNETLEVAASFDLFVDRMRPDPLMA